MPRPKRLNLPKIPQHVVQRGNNRQPCFFRETDYRLYLSLLAMACEKHQCEVHAYVLMTNHVHLLITPQLAHGVSLLMRDLGRDYVRQVNRENCRTGTMWEGRFKSSLVDSLDYCLACYRYIELNPVRANMVTHAQDYRWSSFNCNALGHSNSLISPHDCWLELGKTDSQRMHSYLSLFEHRINKHRVENIRYALRKGLPTGSKEFKQQIENALSIKLGNGKRGRPLK